tara:strand:+ start:680 stop:1162 length:483 start_codon:yes stop_codon:yes gene_type:complete
MEVKDNFLPDNIFEYVRGHIMSPGLPWLFQPTVAKETDDMSYDNYMYSHMVYHEQRPRSPVYEDLIPLVEQLNVKSVIRILLNAYPYTPKLQLHADHIDFEYPHKGAILYLNTCDGYTYCEGEKVYSVANRLLIHDPSKLHHSTTTSNAQRRVICNVNYF